MSTGPAFPDLDERGPRTFMLFFFLRGTRKAVLWRAGLLTTLIALCDRSIEGNIPLGFLYLFPMLLAGSVMTRWQIAASAVSARADGAASGERRCAWTRDTGRHQVRPSHGTRRRRTGSNRRVERAARRRHVLRRAVDHSCGHLWTTA